MENKRTIAVLLAGGIGRRLKANIPKQYIEINNEPIIAYTMKSLMACKEVIAIQIIADECWRDYICQKVSTEKLLGFTLPGKTRQLSIWNALNDVKKQIECKQLGINCLENVQILVQDAVRPWCSEALIKRCINESMQTDGAMPVVRMNDTVYYSVDGKKIDRLIERSALYAGQAPECFDFIKYYEANKKLLPDKILDINGSTEVAFLAGMNIKLFEGEESNLKITTSADLDSFIEHINSNKNLH